jgi:transposase
VEIRHYHLSWKLHHEAYRRTAGHWNEHRQKCVSHHLVDVENREKRLKLKRSQVVPFFANCQPALVAMEACGSAHYCGRTLQLQGHQVKLLPPTLVKPLVVRDKTDVRDAQTIWVVVQQPHIRQLPSRVSSKRPASPCTACALN